MIEIVIDQLICVVLGKSTSICHNNSLVFLYNSNKAKSQSTTYTNSLPTFDFDVISWEGKVSLVKISTVLVL